MRKRHDFRRLKIHVLIFFIILLLGLLNFKVKAGDNSSEIRWLGMVSPAWHQSGNWSGGKIPSGDNNVIISGNTLFQPVMAKDASCKTLKIEKGALLELTGNVAFSITGNLINSGIFSCGNSTVIFSSSQPQEIRSLSPVAFYNLTINNRSAQGIKSENKIVIGSKLKFISGCLSSTDTVEILNDEADAITGYSETAYMAGNLKRKIKNSSEENYFFPVGLGGKGGYFPARLDISLLEGTQFITTAFRKPERYTREVNGIWDDDIHCTFIASEGMWVISPDRQPSGGWYDLRLYTVNISGLADNMFSIVKRPEGADANSWIAHFGESNPFGGEGRLVADGYALKKYCTGFSEYAIGGSGVGIPVELIRFDARRGEEGVIISWTTATETANSFFVVEKSNGTDFKEVARMDGSGNSSVQRNYQVLDRQPYTGTSYYRLRQYDFNGRYAYSKAVSVRNPPVHTPIMIFPNPSEGSVVMSFGTEVSEVDVIVYNQHGAISLTKSYRSASKIKMDLKNELAAGIYYLQISTGTDDLNIQKIVIE